MSPLRKKKLEASILREFARLIIRQQAKDDRIEFVAVKEVELRGDFSSARVQLSLFGTPEGNASCYTAIQSYIHRFQSLIGRNLRLRFTPRLILSIAPPQMEEGQDVSPAFLPSEAETEAKPSFSDRAP